MRKHFKIAKWTRNRRIGAAVLVLALVSMIGLAWRTAKRESGPSGQVLYNGIQLAPAWPPRDVKYSFDPLPVAPYLSSPPAVIPIDVGRQLFVDDFLVQETSLHRSFHAADYYPANPVMKPDKPWETTRYPDRPKWRDSWATPTAMVFSDGVWYDPKDKLFKMWYMGGYISSFCYATSKDGIHWEKPILDIFPGTNKVQETNEGRESSTVWLDLEEKDPARRFKMFYHPWARMGEELRICFSPDGFRWTKPVLGGLNGDRTTVFFNPFRKVWVFSIRSGANGVRTRNYWEHPTVLPGAQWKEGDPVFWVGADKLDSPAADRAAAELYNLDCVAYESVIVGLFSILHGYEPGRPKLNELFVGFSRDGFHWDRSGRQVFIPVVDKPGQWNRGNVQSAGGCCLVVGDKLHFYVSGRAGEKESTESGVCSTGLATLRRDGFASLDAGGEEGLLITRPVTFGGKYLFVNVDAPKGLLSAEVVDEKGRVIQPFSRANCKAVTADRTLQAITWNGSKDLSQVSRKPVRFKFYLTNGKLYAFWVSKTATGASSGYVAAGGPGFTGPTDTVGASYGH